MSHLKSGVLAVSVGVISRVSFAHIFSRSLSAGDRMRQVFEGSLGHPEVFPLECDIKDKQPAVAQQ